MKISCVVIIIGIVSLLTSKAFAEVYEALYATQAEIDIWNDRKTNGPYDDGWDRIVLRADRFKADPDPRWTGLVSATCHTGDFYDAKPSRIQDRGLRDCGFVYLLTGDTDYRDAARDALLAQIAVTGTDFSDSVRWCSNVSGDQSYLDISNWLFRLLLGYSWIRSSLTSQQQSDLDQWFLDAGNHIWVSMENVIKTRFSNHLSDDYTCDGAYCPGSNKGYTHYGGQMNRTFNEGWSNIMSCNGAFVGATGIFLGDDTLKNNAIRYFKEWIKYRTDANGVVYDQYKWNVNNGNAQKGYYYQGLTIGSMIALAEIFARNGDTSLYDYSTSDGMYGSEGGPKTLLGVLQHFSQLTNATIYEYADTDESDPGQRIDQLGVIDDQIEFIYMCPANTYYQDWNLETACKTTLPGRWWHPGVEGRDGDWGRFPDIRFMFAQNENVVWPYPSIGDTLPAAPTNLKIAGVGP